MVSSPMQGPADPDRGADSAPSAKAVVSMGLPDEREYLMAAGLPINVVAIIKSTREALTRVLYVLKWQIFEAWCGRRSLSPYQ